MCIFILFWIELQYLTIHFHLLLLSTQLFIYHFFSSFWASDAENFNDSAEY